MWALLPGVLKATTGAHEVITTMMMSWIGLYLSSYLVKNVLMDPRSTIPASNTITEQARLLTLDKVLPFLFRGSTRLHLGVFLAVLAAIFIWYLLTRTTLGFEVRAVGSNPFAAEAGGVSVSRNTILALLISGGLAGIAGTVEIMGLHYRVYDRFSAGYGFTGITVALLAKNHPLGVIPAALLFGALTNGGAGMQLKAGIPIDIVDVLSGVIIFLVAAEELVNAVGRRREKRRTAARADAGPGDQRRGGGVMDIGHALTVILDILREPSTYQAMIRISTPLALAAIGGTFCERTGVVNIALEGIMLVGAFAGAVFSYYAQASWGFSEAMAPWVGLIGAVSTGMLFSLLHGVGSIHLRADQVVVGAALNILALGATGFLTQAIFGVAGASPRVGSFDPVPIPGLVKIPFLGQVLFNHTPIVYMAIVIAKEESSSCSARRSASVLQSVGEQPQGRGHRGHIGVQDAVDRHVYSGALGGLAGANLRWKPCPSSLRT